MVASQDLPLMHRAEPLSTVPARHMTLESKNLSPNDQLCMGSLLDEHANTRECSMNYSLCSCSEATERMITGKHLAVFVEVDLHTLTWTWAKCPYRIHGFGVSAQSPCDNSLQFTVGHTPRHPKPRTTSPGRGCHGCCAQPCEPGAAHPRGTAGRRWARVIEAGRTLSLCLDSRVLRSTTRASTARKTKADGRPGPNPHAEVRSEPAQQSQPSAHAPFLRVVFP
ncbi:uncharacterized protein LOC114009635 [Tupaia chinensis]|uniref:uncharacterized protein LOC114009635 n=1 Tax=Tupaia chinensis TaxID=246437 RepID=UPI000FFC15D8|nr:uncharacterized protein LOC114009635 [Tupaia chinensis]